MDLIVPVYINQKLVFDLVAMMQGGIATVTKVTESSSSALDSNTSASGSFGLSEAFSSLLKINLAGEISDTQKKEKATNTTEERIHTPASLFYELRSRLLEKDLIKSEKAELPNPGDFIEFKASLNRNPVIVGMDALTSLLDLSALFKDEPKNKGKKGGGNKLSEVQILSQRLSTISESLKEGGSRDLVAELVTAECKVVLTVEEQFLNDSTMSDIADGTFSVLGKVVRSFADESKSINLLRKTSLAHAPDVMSELLKLFNGLDENTFDMPEMESHVKGPAIQVIPIAIYS